MQEQPPPWSSPSPAMSEPREAPRGIRYIEALSFLFSTEDAWPNLGYALLLVIIPIVGPIALLGWQTEILQRLVKRHPRPIPKFDFGDFNAYLTRGVPPFLVNMVIAMPFGLVFGVGFGLVNGIAGFASATARHASRGAAPDFTILYILLGVGGVGMLLFMPVFAIISYAASTRAELTEDFGETMKLGPLFGYVRATLVTTLLAFFVWGFLSGAVVTVGLVLCFIGVYPASILVRMGGVHLRWQIYEEYLAKGGEPIKLKERTELLPSEARMAR